MSNPSYSIRDIAEVLGISKRATEMRATCESWSYEETTGRGGKRRLYQLNDLPEAIQAALLKVHGVEDVPTTTPYETAGAAAAEAEAKPQFSYDAESLWIWAQTRTQKLRDEGAHKAQLLRQVN